MAPDGRTQVNFRVSEDQLAEWDGHVDAEPLYDKRSDLIKVAVRNQIRRDRGQVEGGGVQNLGPITDAVSALEDRLERVADDVAEVREAIAAESGVGDETVSAVFSALPVTDLDGDGAGIIKGATPSDVADETGISVQEAEIALAQLRRETGVVRMVMTGADDEPTYWRQE